MKRWSIVLAALALALLTGISAPAGASAQHGLSARGPVILMTSMEAGGAQPA
ncbi:hypothetical protein [Ligaoa zhengdingensis]|uniref:hypothetical protein n=1 Tax=Ligaoa zhengdingensis TaxID=2763658 RepID=UPI0031BAB8D1